MKTSSLTALRSLGALIVLMVAAVAAAPAHAQQRRTPIAITPDDACGGSLLTPRPDLVLQGAGENANIDNAVTLMFFDHQNHVIQKFGFLSNTGDVAREAIGHIQGFPVKKGLTLKSVLVCTGIAGAVQVVEGSGSVPVVHVAVAESSLTPAQRATTDRALTAAPKRDVVIIRQAETMKPGETKTIKVSGHHEIAKIKVIYSDRWSVDTK